MNGTRRRVLFWIIATLLIAICAGSILILRSIELPQRYRRFIESRLRGATGRDVRIGGASLRFLGGMGIEFQDLIIKDWDRKSDLIRAKGLILQMRLLPLLRRQLRWKSLILERPSVRIRRSHKGSFNLWANRQESIRGGTEEYPHILGLLSSFSGGRIKILGGSVEFVDDSVASGPVIVRLENLHLELGSIFTDAPMGFRVHARQPHSKGPDGRVSMVGNLHSPPDPLEWSKIRIAAEVRAKNVNTLPLWPYYGPRTPLKGIEGFLDIHAHYEGDFSGLFRSWGQIRVKDVAFDYSQVFDTVLRPERFVIDYEVTLNENSLTLSNVRFRLPEIEIRGRCAFHEINSPRRRVEAFATTGPFDLDEVKQYLPFRILSPGLGKLMRDITRKGRGRIVSLRVEGRISDFTRLGDPEKADLIYGKMRLDGIAFPFARDLRAIENISGWVTLEKGSLTFGDLEGSLGKSKLDASEMIISHIYSSPRLKLTLDGKIDMKGIREIAKPGASLGNGIPIGNMSGRGNLRLKLAGVLTGPSRLSYDGHLVLRRATLTMKGTGLRVAGISGKVLFSNSRVRGKGIQYKGGVSLRKATLRHPRMVSPVRFLKGEVHFTPKIIRLSEVEGKWRRVGFSELAAQINLAKGTLHVKRFHCKVEGGEVNATARVDIGNKGQVAFALNPKLSHVDAGHFFRDCGLQERLWITGALNLRGSLRGRGRSGEEVRRSLEGKLKVEMEKGRIRRFHILSKVFSLLNVLQLFRGKLPELTGEGLPYNIITGEIGIARGIARTENLLVDSDAMKITIVGGADMARETLDLIVGLHPLGTIDAIVSRVPVVGRILAGEDASVICYYVEVRGDVSNPQVKHIPLKSMERGLLEIMRRVLETPMHIIPRAK